MSSFLDTIVPDVEAEAAKLGGDLKTIGSELLTEGVADIKDIFEQGIPIATQAVAAAAKMVLSGDTKFSTVVTSVAQALEIKLGPVAIQDIWMLVQFVFRSLGALSL